MRNEITSPFHFVDYEERDKRWVFGIAERNAGQARQEAFGAGMPEDGFATLWAKMPQRVFGVPRHNAGFSFSGACLVFRCRARSSLPAFIQHAAEDIVAGRRVILGAAFGTLRLQDMSAADTARKNDAALAGRPG